MDRWFDDKGNLNVNAIFEDVMLLKNRDSIFQKLVNEASSQTLEQRLKKQTNVSLEQANKKPLKVATLRTWKTNCIPLAKRLVQRFIN